MSVEPAGPDRSIELSSLALLTTGLCRIKLIMLAIVLPGAILTGMISPVMAADNRFEDIESGINRAVQVKVRNKRQLAAGGPVDTAREQHKLKKVKFVNHHCSILMPRQFTKKFQSEGTGAKVGTYSGSDYPHGTLTLTCASVPQNCAASSLLIDRIATDKRLVKEVKKLSTCQLDGTQGKQFDVITTKSSPQDSGRIKGFVSGQNLYLMSAFGSKPWLESSTVEQFFNSLEIEQGKR